MNHKILDLGAKGGPRSSCSTFSLNEPEKAPFKLKTDSNLNSNFENKDSQKINVEEYPLLIREKHKEQTEGEI